MQELTDIFFRTDNIVTILSLILALTFLIIAFIHFNWATGSNWGLDSALPSKATGEILYTPRKIDSAVVGIGLLSFSVLYLIKSGIVTLGLNQIANYTYWVIPIIFLLRAIGDFRYAGLFKKIKNTKFAVADSKFFTPLCFILAILGFVVAAL